MSTRILPQPGAALISETIQARRQCPDGYIDAIWRAARAGAIDWPEAQQLQNATLPCCAPHGRPAVGTFNGVRVCELCMTEGRHRT